MTTWSDTLLLSKEQRQAAWLALVIDDVFRNRTTLSEFESFAIRRFNNTEKRSRLLINMSWVCNQIGHLDREQRAYVLANSSARNPCASIAYLHAGGNTKAATAAHTGEQATR